MFKKIANRIYEDYFMPSRLPEYERIITAALGQRYEHLTLYEFYLLARDKKIDPARKYFIHRHDIDTDTSTARAMFEIEKKHGIKSSWYFRLSTLDYKLMEEIHHYGSEVSYHFEELAQHCKDKKIKSREKAFGDLEKIKQKFVENFIEIEGTLGFKLRSVVSHGDFVNRRLGITNSVLLEEDIRKKLKIDVEGYDPVLIDNYSVILSDMSYPRFYRPMSPFEALDKSYPVIYLLTHPRHWRSNIGVNTVDNIKRLAEGIRYAI